MKLKVVVKDAIVISSEQLEAFAKLIQVPFSVEPVFEDQTGQSEAVATPAPRARKVKEPKAETKAETKTVEPPVKSVVSPAGDAEALDYNAVLAKFTSLVESDFDKAVALLDGYGVSRFSDLNVVQVSDLAKKL